MAFSFKKYLQLIHAFFSYIQAFLCKLMAVIHLATHERSFSMAKKDKKAETPEVQRDDALFETLGKNKKRKRIFGPT